MSNSAIEPGSGTSAQRYAHALEMRDVVSTPEKLRTSAVAQATIDRTLQGLPTWDRALERLLQGAGEVAT